MLTIRHPEAERLAHELASRRGQPVEDVVLAALQAERMRDSTPAQRLHGQGLRDAVRQIQERVASRPILDDRPADEIVGYNDDGTFD